MSNDWKRRCAELEVIAENCRNAFEVIPIWALEREEIWMPSEDALWLLKKAKDSIRDYEMRHGKHNNGR